MRRGSRRERKKEWRRGREGSRKMGKGKGEGKFTSRPVWSNSAIVQLSKLKNF